MHTRQNWEAGISRFVDERPPSGKKLSHASSVRYSSTAKDGSNMPSSNPGQPISKAEFAAPSLCPEGLVRICGGNREFARTLLDKFKLTAPCQLGDIVEARRQNDLSALKVAAHSLKGSAAIMGAAAISKSASELEQSVLRADIGDIDQQIDHLNELLSRVLAVFL